MDVIALAQQGIPQRGGDPRHGDQRGTHQACSAWYRASCSVSTATRPGARRPGAPWSRCCRTCRTASACASCSSPRARTRTAWYAPRARMPSAHASPSRPAAGGVLLPATDAGGRPRHPGRQGPPGDPRRAAAGEDSGNNLRLLMRQRLSEITGLSGENIGQLAHHSPPPSSMDHGAKRRLGRRRLFRRQRLLRERASHAPFDAAPGYVEAQPRKSWNKGQEALGRQEVGWQEEVGQRRPRRLQGSATNAGQRGVHHPQRPAHLAASSAVGLEGRRCGHPRQGSRIPTPSCWCPCWKPCRRTRGRARCNSSRAGTARPRAACCRPWARREWLIVQGEP